MRQRSRSSRNYPALIRRKYAMRHSRRSRERLILAAVAGFACMVCFMIVVLLSFKEPVAASIEKAPAPVAVSPVSTVTVLAPAQAVRSGTKFSDIRLKEVYWSRTSVPSDAVLDPEELRGMYAKTDLLAAVPLRREHLTREPIKSLPVGEGFRAITLDVDVAGLIEGHAVPGTRHDLTLTYHRDGALTTKVLVQDVRVLSLGGYTEVVRTKSGANSRRGKIRTVTLEIRPQDALAIHTARPVGRLALLMRANGDNRGLKEQEVDQYDFDTRQKNKHLRAKKGKCGTMKIHGEEFLMGCDGSLTAVPLIDGDDGIEFSPL